MKYLDILFEPIAHPSQEESALAIGKCAGISIANSLGFELPHDSPSQKGFVRDVNWQTGWLKRQDLF
jgi:hypothetical protein